MTINPSTERARRSRRFRGLVAGAAGLSLLLGGSTFAMWHDSTTGNFGTIKHGALRIVGPTTEEAAKARAFDTRQTKPGDQTRTAVANPNAKFIWWDEFEAVPGDVIEIDQKIWVTAYGDNMRFKFTGAAAEEITDDAWSLDISVWKGNAQQGESITVNSFNTTPTEISDVLMPTTGLYDEYTIVVIATLNSKLGERTQAADGVQADETGTERQGDSLNLPVFTIGVQQVDLPSA
ncbi:MAG: SipW-dependent-type signal peptide-containing protein [Bifidobacteriaceae bacterium]|nr:SipW-dependent-type signal peptide-containing protein [Bifidobacteriaceae bacterium]